MSERKTSDSTVATHQVFRIHRAYSSSIRFWLTFLRLRFSCETTIVNLQIRGREKNQVRRGLVANTLMSEVSLMRPAAEISNTYDENNVALHKVRRGDRGERRVPDDSARGWYHCQKRCEDSFGLLELIELDECVEEGHGDEDAAEIRVREVVLWNMVSFIKRNHGGRVLTLKSMPSSIYSRIPAMMRMILNIVARQSKY